MADKKSTIDIDLIRSAASTRWPEIIAHLCAFPAEILDGGHHPCPKCGGHDRFRMIDAAAGSLLCNQCFREKNGDGFAAIQWACGLDFIAAAAKVGEYLGIQPSANGSHKRGRKRGNIDPAEQLKFVPWNDALAALWCMWKPPITVAALLAAGARQAQYYSNKVIALPVYGEKLTAADPVGWCLYNITGGMLPKWKKGLNGKAEPDEPVKVKLTYGSQPGIIGPVGLLPSATTIWKVEGPTDMLAALSLADLPPLTIPITNANGCGETPAPWILELFAGREAITCHDADQPGQRGAIGHTDDKGKFRPGWAQAIATRATTSRNAVLPFPISENHGSDLRDFINAGKTFLDLAAIAVDSPTVAGQAPEPDDTKPLEAYDDPHYLARRNLEKYATHAKGATIRSWRGEWFTWKESRGCYRRIEEVELRAKITSVVKHVFDEFNVLEINDYNKRKKTNELTDKELETGPPKAKKVYPTLVSATAAATESLCLIPSSVEQMTWLDRKDDPTAHRNFIAFRNGVLDLDQLLADESAELSDVLLPHSPQWFSTIRLPYDFDPTAACPRWEKYLETSLEMDPERIKILQEWAGYLLLPETSQQKFLALEGEGANGKSVYFAGIAAMLGLENCSSVSVEQLSDKFVRTQTLGKLANICPDVGEIQQTNEGDLKAFVSGDVMFFDRKYLTGLTCTPTARLMVSFNNRPRFQDKSSGIYRRMILMPFNYTVPERDRVLGMDKHTWWQRSGELPGILIWAIAGLHRLRNQGRFTASQLCSNAVEDYRSESNPARSFLAEHLEISEGGKVKCLELYAHYKRWAEANGYRPLGERMFGKEVARTFTVAMRVRGGGRSDRFWFYSNINFTQNEILGNQTIEATLF